ncbi:hypothetical protein BLS_003952 [Venturia inaequalis]|uniref:Uncharacterized protein n=1 Tax=Venturia inaequalis TaxID=5025 RepID=A0A8H3YWR1_VENIN|nr:hypothetical protein BLS_003952 [Venturia inaequalis]
MGVDRVLHDLIVDIDQLNKLYRQLSNVPREVQHLFTHLANSRQLLALSLAQLAKSNVQIDTSNKFSSGKPFSRFRSKLLDLELFLDPQYQLHQSGIRSEIPNATRWIVRDDEHVHATCETFQDDLARLEKDCQDFFSLLRASPRAQFLAEHAGSQAPSPILAPSESSLDSGTSTPNSTRTSSTTRGPDHLKTEEQRILDRFIAQYSASTIAGSKRKRPSRDRRRRPDESTDTPAAISDFLPQPFPSPNVDFAITASPSPGLIPHLNGNEPPWVFDDIRTSLPVFPDPESAPAYQKAKGKEPIQQAVVDESGRSGVSSDSSSSSGSSQPRASRQDSIFTITNKDRTFGEGTTKVWFHKGPQLHVLPIEHIEVRRLDRIKGEGIVIVSKTPSGQDVLDDLWMPSLGTNSCPFLENAEVTSTFHHREKSARFVVCFAPHPEHHPQYSFSTRDDCWDFMQAIAGKTLCASLDVESIKSACTHGHAAEGGCSTIQVWEDDALGLKTIKLFRNKNELAKQKVVEINVNCLRSPKKERGTGKLVMDFRDAKNGPTSEMKYLKIGFSNADAEEGFLHQVGFGPLLT